MSLQGRALIMSTKVAVIQKPLVLLDRERTALLVAHRRKGVASGLMGELRRIAAGRGL